MILTRTELGDVLIKGNVPFFLATTLNTALQGDRFGTVSREWVRETWQAWLAAFRANAPSLVEVRQLGGGRTQLVPRYVLAGYNCRGHGLLCYAHGMTGFALQAATANPPLPYDALAWGFLHYTARPRADNLNRDGRHENLWFVDHDGIFQTFEQSDGEENEMTPDELASITFIYGQ